MSDFERSVKSIEKIIQNLQGVHKIIPYSPMGAFILGSCFIDALAGFHSGRELEVKEKLPNWGKQYKAFIQRYMRGYNTHLLWRDVRCKLVHDFAFNGAYAYTHRAETKEKGAKHLSKAQITVPGSATQTKVVLVAEDFLKDIEKAGQKYLKEVVNDVPKLRNNAIRRYKILGSYHGDAKAATL